MGRIRRVLARYLFLFFNHSKATLALTTVAFFVTDAVRLLIVSEIKGRMALVGFALLAVCAM